MLNAEDLQLALKELGQAIYNHEQWHKDLIRTLVCRLPHDLRDVADDAHRQCRFGQWYHGPAAQKHREQPAFAAIAVEHERMHRMAAGLLRAAAAQAVLPPADYDNFANVLDRLRLELQALKVEIEDVLYRRDPLTGAESRLGMLTCLREAIELVRRRVQPCCIAVIDLDHFKKVNDEHGHLTGDEVLINAVVHTRDHLRQYDRVFRYGGEEFLVLLTNADVQMAGVVVERMRQGLSATALAHHADRAIFVTASFGLTALDPSVGVEASIDRADKALYAAKAAGRNCVRAWESIESR